MKIPDSRKALKLIRASNIVQSERRMVLSICNELKFDSVKSTVTRTFCSLSLRSSILALKEEPVFFAGGTRYGSSGSYGKRRFRGKTSREPQRLQGTNPITRIRKVSRCSRCGSTYHWVEDCPEEDVKPSATNIATSVSQDPEDSQSESKDIVYANISDNLFQDCRGIAILDNGCTSTVCGKAWLDDYLGQLYAVHQKQYKKRYSSKRNFFGSGQPVKTLFPAFFPVEIQDSLLTLATEVVDLQLPLLLSKETLKKLRTNIDMANSRV